MKDYLFEQNHVIFVHNGLKCEITRHYMGFLNAYVYLPKHNAFFGIDELELNNIVQNKKAEISFAEESEDFWKVGISFSSIKDFIPYEPTTDMSKHFDKIAEILGIEKATEKDYKNIDYAIESIKEIADQLNKSVN